MKPDCLEKKMHEKAKLTSADIVMCGFDLVNECGNVLRRNRCQKSQ